MTTSPDHVTTQECLACRATVPAALYCGCCGAALGSDPGFWRRLLQRFVSRAPRSRSPAPGDQLAIPWTSDYFGPVRIGMLLF